MIDNILKIIRGIVKLKGDTDGTKIGNTDDRLRTQSKLVGNDGLHNADVELISGKRKLLTNTSVVIDELLAFDDIADSWFTITAAGATTDTIRVQIVAGYADSTSPDRDTAAVDITTTVTASEAGDELALRDLVISDLNADGNFSAAFTASAGVKDNGIIHISSKFQGEFGERPTGGDLTVTPTGTTTINLGFDKIIRRKKENSGTRDPNDKRFVTFGVSGEVTTIAGGVSDLIPVEFALDGSSSNDMAVDGSVTTKEFTIPADVSKDTFITEMRIVGNDNGIKFGQFLGINTSLTNGITVSIKSDNNNLAFPPMKNTDDLKHLFSKGGGGFQLDVQAGRDDISASFLFDNPCPIRKIGTFAIDDNITIKIDDDLTSVISLNFVAFGFRKEV